MTTSCITLNTLWFPHCLRNKTQTAVTEPPSSGPWPPVCLIYLFRLLYPPTYWTFSEGPMAIFLLPLSFHAWCSICLRHSSSVCFPLSLQLRHPSSRRSYLTPWVQVGSPPLCSWSSLSLIRATPVWALWKILVSLSDLLSVNCKLCLFSSTLYCQFWVQRMPAE